MVSLLFGLKINIHAFLLSGWAQLFSQETEHMSYIRESYQAQKMYSHFLSIPRSRAGELNYNHSCFAIFKMQLQFEFLASF